MYNCKRATTASLGPKFLVHFARPLLWHSPEVPRANIKYHSIQSDSVCMRLLLNIRGVEPSENKATYYWWVVVAAAAASASAAAAGCARAARNPFGGVVDVVFVLLLLLLLLLLLCCCCCCCLFVCLLCFRQV